MSLLYDGYVGLTETVHNETTRMETCVTHSPCRNGTTQTETVHLTQFFDVLIVLHFQSSPRACSSSFTYVKFVAS